MTSVDRTFGGIKVGQYKPLHFSSFLMWHSLNPLLLLSYQKTALIIIMEPSTHQNLHGSSHQPDYTAEPPRNTEGKSLVSCSNRLTLFPLIAPWQAPVSPKGESEWNAAKDSRDHPEWNTTAHGTTNSWEQHPPSTTDSTHSTISPQQQQQGQQEKPQHVGRESGHTVQHERSPRSIRRNLNDI
jgi:hypothetical protein